MSKILIVDDDSVATAIYEEKFRSLGFEIQSASSGREAMTQIAEQPPDLVLLVLVLADMSGVDVLKFIRGHPPSETIPVVVLSNTNMGELIEAAWSAGATKCLSKTASSLTRVGDVVHKILANQAVKRPSATSQVASAKEAMAPVLAEAPKAPESGLASEERAQTTLRSQLHQAVLQRLEEMNQHLNSWQADPTQGLVAAVTEIRRSNHALMSSAALGGWPRLAQIAGALEALLSEIQSAKVRMSASAMQTVRQTVEFLPRLLRDPASSKKVELFESSLILVLDDDEISRKMLCMLLKKVRLNPLAVSEPAIAVKLFSENRFDLVFCDVEMPGMDGFELGNKLRDSELNESTPIVYVTAHGDIKARDRSAKIGAVDFITKPVLSSELALKAMLHLLRSGLLRPSE